MDVTKPPHSQDSTWKCPFHFHVSNQGHLGPTCLYNKLQTAEARTHFHRVPPRGDRLLTDLAMEKETELTQLAAASVQDEWCQLLILREQVRRATGVEAADGSFRRARLQDFPTKNVYVFFSFPLSLSLSLPKPTFI